MDNSKILNAFLQIVRKPFTGEQFISLSGLPPSQAESALSMAVAHGRVNLVQDAPSFESTVFVRKPPKWNKPVRDWSPRRSALQTVLDHMEAGMEYRAPQLREATGFSIRSVERYLAMLVHLGCIQKRVDFISNNPGRPRHHYTRHETDAPLPASIPRYYHSGLARQRQS